MAEEKNYNFHSIAIFILHHVIMKGIPLGALAAIGYGSYHFHPALPWVLIGALVWIDYELDSYKQRE